MKSADVIVLGAGMVGVSAALHLQARGRDVVLIDRRGAGLETSFGNAGLIERSSIFPYLFPRDPVRLIRYALNLLPEAHYHLGALPSVGPWLMRYWRESAPERVRKNIEARRPLIEHSLIEHEALIQQAGGGDAPAAHRLDQALSPSGNARRRRRRRRKAARLRSQHRHSRRRRTSSRASPISPPSPAPCITSTRPSSTIPARWRKAYADLFLSRGGRFIAGDALTLEQERDGRWSVIDAGGPDRGPRRRPCARPMVRPDLPALRLRHAARLQARLSHALRAADRARSSTTRFSTPTTAICWRR